MGTCVTQTFRICIRRVNRFYRVTALSISRLKLFEIISTSNFLPVNKVSDVRFEIICRQINSLPNDKF